MTTAAYQTPAPHWRQRLELEADRAELERAGADLVTVHRADADNLRALAVQLARRVSAPLAAYLATATDQELSWLLDQVTP